MSHSPSTAPSLSEEIRSLWPALLILRRGRDPDVTHQLHGLIRQWLTSHRLMGDEDITPDRLASPATPADVTAWLHRVWQRLSASKASDLLKVRRTIMDEVTRSDLSSNEQADLFTALDYLCRLAGAGMAADARVTAPPEIPHTRSHAMQAAYRSLVRLAASDLPIWLSGEKGVELEDSARLIHRLRGLPEDAFHILDADADEFRETMARLNGPDGSSRFGSEATVVVRCVDESSRLFQRMLYGYLVGDLGRKGTVRVLVTTGTLDLAADIPKELLVDLFALLNPMKLEIPPLRSKTGDLEGLIGFYARSRGLRDPGNRFSAEALEALRGYHWPGNIDELEMVVAFIVEKKPAGPIGLQHLPESIVPPTNQRVKELADILAGIGKDRGFRVLSGRDGCLKLAGFLCDGGDETFTASDVQGLFHLGRDTVRRLLGLLQTEGVIEGIKGAQGRRTTRFRLCNRSRGPGEWAAF